ncbi:Protein of unknown function [Propionibacterium freudenreichii]|nr:Protein of unknown function [Propionibacterium freudenreichii]
MRIADMDAILITTEKDPNLANPPKGFGRSNYESALCNPSRRNESSMTLLWTKRGRPWIDSTDAPCIFCNTGFGATASPDSRPCHAKQPDRGPSRTRAHCACAPTRFPRRRHWAGCGQATSAATRPSCP